MSLNFVSTETSDDIPDNIDGIDIGPSSDLTCEVCGTPLTYAGRGRKPKFCDEHKKSGSSSSSGTNTRSRNNYVDAACASLSAGYGALLLPLMMISPNAAAELRDQIPALETRNRLFLEMDPALAKKIAQSAGKTGGLALVLSHAMAFGPVARIIVEERRERAVARQQAADAAAQFDSAVGF